MNEDSLKKGFTLIELLVSVLIIVILTGSILVVVNPAQIRGRARDSQRVADLKAIQTALENYYLRNRAYPAPFNTAAWTFIRINGINDALTNAIGTNGEGLISPVPTDPEGDGSNDSSPCLIPANNRYNYAAPSRGGQPGAADGYMLTAIMESASSNDGHECDQLDNWGSSCSGGYNTGDFCYGVENR